MNSKTYAIIALFSVQLLYGLNYTFSKVIMNENFMSPFALTVLRVVGATILFWLFSIWFPKEKIEKKDYFKFFIAAIFGVGLNMVLFLKGLELTSPIHASAIVTITPIIILILSVFILKEKITSIKVLGVVLGFLGAVILTIYGKSTRAADNVVLGNAIVLLNCVSYSIYIILIKQLTEKYSPLTFIKWLFLFGIFIVLPFGYSDLQAVVWNSITPYIWFSIGFVVIGATFGTYLLNPYALSKLKASTVGVFIYFQPVIAGLFAIIMGVDTVSTVKVLAMVIIFLGVYLVYMKK